MYSTSGRPTVRSAIVRPAAVSCCPLTSVSREAISLYLMDGFQSNLAYTLCAKKRPLLFFKYLCQKLTDFNDSWRVTS